MTSNKRYVSELTVLEAAALLDVSPRTIINYIRDKELEATKVGKSWFIKSPSFDSFCQRYKFKQTHQKEEFQNSSTTTQTAQEAPKDVSRLTTNTRRKKKESYYSITQLRLFELSKEILQNITPQNLNLPNNEVIERIQDMKFDAIELLGAGCYSYSKKDKHRLYQKSREKIGGIVSLYYFNQTSDTISSIIKSLEEDLLPAYSALIRKMENPERKEKRA